MTTNRKRVACPFCEGDGCCFCDHEGHIFVGPNEMIKSEAGLNSVGVQYLKESDKESQLESWPEMFEFFLDEKNVRSLETLNARLIEALKRQTDIK